MYVNKNTIAICSEGYWNFGSDQINVDFPCKFPTVSIALEETDTLDKAADAIRVELGYKPMFPPHSGELDPDECDDVGWYNFYVGLNGFDDLIVDGCIEAIVQSERAEDNEQSYLIPLTEEERVEIYKVLDEQLKERFGTSCDQLLEEARLEMIELEEYRAKHKEGF